MMPLVCPPPVDGEQVPEHRLNDKPVEHCAEDGVVVQPSGQQGVPSGLISPLAVDHALVEIGCPQPPDPAAELDIVAVMHL